MIYIIVINESKIERYTVKTNIRKVDGPPFK